MTPTSQVDLEIGSTSQLNVVRSGIVEYGQALAMQRSIHSEVVSGARANTLILLEHPSVFTAGKRTLDSEKPHDGTPVVDVDRGGKLRGMGQVSWSVIPS